MAFIMLMVIMTLMDFMVFMTFLKPESWIWLIFIDIRHSHILVYKMADTQPISIWIEGIAMHKVCYDEPKFDSSSWYEIYNFIVF
jgi:hypothetical protein